MEAELARLLRTRGLGKEWQTVVIAGHAKNEAEGALLITVKRASFIAERTLWLDRHIEADPRVMQFFARPLTRAESDAMVDRIEKHFDTHRLGLWAVEALGIAPYRLYQPVGVEGAFDRPESRGPLPHSITKILERPHTPFTTPAAEPLRLLTWSAEDEASFLLALRLAREEISKRRASLRTATTNNAVRSITKST